MSNMASFVMSYFDYNRDDITTLTVGKGTRLSIGYSDKKDDIFVDLKNCRADNRDVFYHYSQSTMYERFLKRMIL